MRICLASFMHDRSTSPVVAAFNRLAEAHGTGKHALTDQEACADCILFVDLHLCPDPSLRPLFDHPSLQKYPQKCMVYDERDEPWCALRGVYVSMPSRYFDPQRQRAFSYYASSTSVQVENANPPDLLFSFIGSPGHRTSGGFKVRNQLLALQHPRAVLEDSSGFVFYDDKGDATAHEKRQRRFAQVMQRSKFILCPRGRGTSSIRMYEALRAGRVPIVFADQWVQPHGPDLNKCILRFPEAAAANIAALLEDQEQHWPEMSQQAISVYQQWFSPAVVLSRLFDCCQSLQGTTMLPAPSRWLDGGYRHMRRRMILQAGRGWGGRFVRALKRPASVKESY